MTPRNGVDGVNGETDIVIDKKTVKGPILLEKPKPLTDFNVISCVRLDDPSDGKCANCKDTETLPYQVENTKGEFGFVCKRCGEFFLQLIEKQRKVD